MEPKPCARCECQHFEDYDLCRWCAEEKQSELEHRLRDDDGAASLMAVASWAVWGLPEVR